MKNGQQDSRGINFLKINSNKLTEELTGMAKAKGSNASSNSTQEKIVTKYDKKVQKRKEQERKEALRKKIFSVAATVIAVIIVAAAGTAVWLNYDKVHHKYIAVDGDPISQIEFDFYYSLTKQNILNQEIYTDMTYGTYFASYLGYDSSKSDSAQSYGSDGTYTWYDYFANNTLSTIMEYKALLKEADSRGYEYSSDDDYNDFVEDFKSSAEAAGVSVSEYYKTVFGEHSTEKNLKGFICEYLKAAAFQDELRQELAPDTEEVAEYYQEHKDDYDTVDYRILDIAAETQNDSASLADAKTKAEEMMPKVTDEASFNTLCIEYAADPDTYSGDADASLKTSASKSSIGGDTADWLFDGSRQTGDITVIENADQSKCSVVMFVQRSYDKDNDEAISQTILNQNYSDLITSYTENMSVENKSNRIKMYEE